MLGIVLVRFLGGCGSAVGCLGILGSGAGSQGPSWFGEESPLWSSCIHLSVEGHAPSDWADATSFQRRPCPCRAAEGSNRRQLHLHREGCGKGPCHLRRPSPERDRDSSFLLCGFVTEYVRRIYIHGFSKCRNASTADDTERFQPPQPGRDRSPA